MTDDHDRCRTWSTHKHIYVANILWCQFCVNTFCFTNVCGLDYPQNEISCSIHYGIASIPFRNGLKTLLMFVAGREEPYTVHTVTCALCRGLSTSCLQAPLMLPYLDSPAFLFNFVRIEPVGGWQLLLFPCGNASTACMAQYVQLLFTVQFENFCISK